MKTFVSSGAAATLVLGMAVAAPAIAATVPTATTDTASMISSSSASIDATVNPNGATTTYAFQYGTTTNYGSQTATAAAGSSRRTTSAPPAFAAAMRSGGGCSSLGQAMSSWKPKRCAASIHDDSTLL